MAFFEFKTFDETTLNTAINLLVYSKNKIVKLCKNGKFIHKIRIYISEKISQSFFDHKEVN